LKRSISFVTYDYQLERLLFSGVKYSIVCCFSKWILSNSILLIVKCVSESQSNLLRAPLLTDYWVVE